MAVPAAVAFVYNTSLYHIASVYTTILLHVFPVKYRIFKPLKEAIKAVISDFEMIPYFVSMSLSLKALFNTNDRLFISKNNVSKSDDFGREAAKY